MANTYNFYKPKLDSEYPEVNGPVSITTYISALDESYSHFREKAVKIQKACAGNNDPDGSSSAEPKSAFSRDSVDYPVFHSPYGKMVQKVHARLIYFLSYPSDPKFESVPSPDHILALSHEASLADKNLEKTFIALAASQYKKTVMPSMHCSRRCGNMYTASLYGGLASLISPVEPVVLLGKRIVMFAYGAGCASSFFCIRVKGDTREIQEKMNLLSRLASMEVVPCQEYVEALELWEKNHMHAVTFRRGRSMISGLVHFISNSLMASTGGSTGVLLLDCP